MGRVSALWVGLRGWRGLFWRYGIRGADVRTLERIASIRRPVTGRRKFDIRRDLLRAA